MKFNDYRDDAYIGLKRIEIELGRVLTDVEIRIAKGAFHTGLDLGSHYGYNEARAEYYEDAMKYRDLCK